MDSLISTVVLRAADWMLFHASRFGIGYSFGLIPERNDVANMARAFERLLSPARKVKLCGIEIISIFRGQCGH
jgi:hypothetical protein